MGAPKTNATVTGGAVYSCPASKQVSLFPNSSCYSYPSPPFVQGNSTLNGLSIAVEATQDVMVIFLIWKQYFNSIKIMTYFVCHQYVDRSKYFHSFEFYVIEILVINMSFSLQRDSYYKKEEQKSLI